MLLDFTLGLQRRLAYTLDCVPVINLSICPNSHAMLTSFVVSLYFQAVDYITYSVRWHCL